MDGVIVDDLINRIKDILLMKDRVDRVIMIDEIKKDMRLFVATSSTGLFGMGDVGNAIYSLKKSLTR